MARMLPQEIPGFVAADPLRAAERRIYRTLQQQLNDDWTVFYSRPWLGQDRFGREIDGEADFVVAHALFGLLTVEVKGGRIERDAERASWTSTDRNGVVHPIKDPVQQARTCKHQILQKLRDSSAWKSRYIRAAHGVILPDCVSPNWDPGIDMPLALFAFQPDMSDLADWVAQRLRTDEPPAGSPERPLGQDGLHALDLLLARSFHLRSPLQSHLTMEERSIFLLTEQQYHVLEGLEGQSRCLIIGGAGTGKTLLAAEKARRLAVEGRSPLLLCYNRPLADHLAAGFAGHPDPPRVDTFHHLALDIIDRAGLNGTQPVGVDDDEYFGALLPELMIKAIERLPDERADALVIDEAQDFRTDWWIALEFLLRDGRDGTLYAFADDNQQLYQSAAAGLMDSFPMTYRLTRNLRNTKSIFAAARPFYAGVTHECSGPAGRSIATVQLGANEDPLGRLRQELGSLTATENVPEGNIAILTGRDQDRAGRIRSALQDRYTVRTAVATEALVVDSVWRFKGLERPVVILMDLQNLISLPELAYVGFSRAQVHLVVMGTAEQLRRLVPAG